MKIQMRRMSMLFCLVFTVSSYYVLFFTSLFTTQIRSFMYILSGHNSNLGQDLGIARLVAQTMEKTPVSDMFQHHYNSVLAQVQIGSYMNFTVYMITFFIVTPLFLIYLFLLRNNQLAGSFEREKTYWSMFKANFFNYVFTSFMLSGVGSILSSFLSMLTRSDLTSANQVAIQNNLQSNFLVSIIPIVILAPIIEEIVFRGVLLSSIKQFLVRHVDFNATKIIKIYKDIQFEQSELIAIITSAVLFALIHLSTNFNQWVYFPAYFFGGLALGGIYVWNKERVYVSIVVHAVYNALPIFLMAITKLIFKG